MEMIFLLKNSWPIGGNKYFSFICNIRASCYKYYLVSSLLLFYSIYCVSVRCCFLFDKSYMKLIIYYQHTSLESIHKVQYTDCSGDTHRFFLNLLTYCSLVYISSSFNFYFFFFVSIVYTPGTVRIMLNCYQNNVSSFFLSFLQNALFPHTKSEGFFFFYE